MRRRRTDEPALDQVTSCPVALHRFLLQPTVREMWDEVNRHIAHCGLLPEDLVCGASSLINLEVCGANLMGVRARGKRHGEEQRKHGLRPSHWVIASSG